MDNFLKSLKKDIQYYSEFLQGFSNEILDSGISKYPIFVAYQMEVSPAIGRQAIDHTKIETTWSINVSVLEEFVKLGLVQREKVAEFRNHYKDPDLFFCIFVLNDQSQANFVYMPREFLPTQDTP